MMFWRDMDIKKNLQKRFRVICVMDPRNMNIIRNEIGVTYDMMRGFLGERKTYHKSLCMIEAWIKREEKRLEIV